MDSLREAGSWTLTVETYNSGVRVLLVSTYDMGRQPFGLASPAAWLQDAGVDVSCVDLAREKLREDQIRGAEIVGFWALFSTSRQSIDLSSVAHNLTWCGG